MTTEQEKEMTGQIRAQIMAMNEVNLEAAPIFAKFCGDLMKELSGNGFSREEAMEIIKATTGRGR